MPYNNTIKYNTIHHENSIKYNTINKTVVTTRNNTTQYDTKI